MRCLPATSKHDRRGEFIHSNTVLSDAMESIVNVAAGSFALYSLILAAKPRDREHPF